MYRNVLWFALAIVATMASGVGAPGQLQAQSILDGRLYFVHGLPGDDLDTDLVDVPNRLPVDVSVGPVGNLTCIFANVDFGTISGPYTLAPGAYQVAISLADRVNPGSGTLVANMTLSVRQFQSVTVVAHTATTSTPALMSFDNPRGFPGFLNARVISRHTANAGAADFVLSSLFGQPGSAALGLVPGGQSAPVTLLLGPYQLRITPAGTPQTDLITPLTQFLIPWSSYYYYAVGTPANGTFQVLVHRIPPF